MTSLGHFGDTFAGGGLAILTASAHLWGAKFGFLHIIINKQMLLTIPPTCQLIHQLLQVFVFCLYGMAFPAILWIVSVLCPCFIKMKSQS